MEVNDMEPRPIKEGIIWRVGNANSINIYDDKWIPSFQNNLRQILTDATDQSMVQSLITHQQWNLNLVEEKFPHFVASEIISIPLSVNDKEYSRFWRHDKKGKYSVREGYRLGISLYTPPENQSEITTQSWWKFIWSLSLPPKVRIFWWKLYHDAIATCLNLLSHHVPVTGRCPLCNAGMDTTSHALFSCTTSKACWKATEFYYLIGSIKCHDSRDICLWLMNELGRQQFEKFALCTWAIRKERSSWLHSEGDRAHSKTIGWSMDFLGDYQNMKCMTLSTSDSIIEESPVRWLPPPLGSLRLDVDASYNTNLNAFAVGGVVRNHQGQLLCAFGKQTKQPISVTHGELITLQEGLKLLYEENYQAVHIMSDSLLAVQAVTKPHKDFGYIGTIAAEIGELIKSPIVSQLHHIRRLANRVAHAWAKFSISSPTLVFWVSGDFPFWFEKLVSDNFEY